MTAPKPFAALFPEKYVCLTTFRKSGVGVPTTVWAAEEGGALFVTTMGSSGKVKRIRNSPHVTLQPATMRGRIKGDAPAVPAHAAIIDDPAGLLAGNAVLEAKYGWQFRMALRSENRRTRGRAGASGRVIVKITAV